MFCSNCGKELGDDMQFCPSCGTKTEMTQFQEARIDAQPDSSEERSDSVSSGINDEACAQAQEEEYQKRKIISGIEVSGDFKELSQMTQKVRSREKTWSIIGKLLAVCYMLLAARVLFSDILAFFDEENSIWQFVNDFAGLILLACIAVYVFLELVLPRVDAKKNVLAGEYLKLLSVSDNQELMKAANEMHCSAVKSAYMDENGNVCIQGKRCKHTFRKNEEGELELKSGRENYKTALEKESIAGCLLKYLSPDAPVNAYENERYNDRLSKAKKILAVISAVTVVIFGFLSMNPNMLEGSSKYIRMVKEGTPEAYPKITYGNAFDDFFENCKWKYFKSEDGSDVVEFHGNCLSDGQKAEAGIQFLVFEEKNRFELHAVTLDGESQTKLVSGLFLIQIFESYGSNDGMGTLSDEEENHADTASSETSEPEKETEVAENQKEGEESGNQTVRTDTDLLYPILYQGYADGYNPCPVMVNDEISGEPKCGTFDEMLTSIVDDGQTMYAPPVMQGGKIYTATRWDAPEAEWYDGLLTYGQFSTLIFWMEAVHNESGAMDIFTGGSWDDVGALAGRWSGGSQEIAISIGTEFSYVNAYGGIGNAAIEDQEGTLYLFGREGNNVYVQWLTESGEEIIFRYQDSGEMQVWYASESCPIEKGTQLTCVERFVS